jgi:hypothetical protein
MQMNKYLSLMLLIFTLALPQLVAAEAVKVRHFGSIYSDADGKALLEPAGVSYRDPLLLIADSVSKSVLSYRYQQGEVVPVARYELPGTFPLQVQQTDGGEIYVLDGRDRQILILDANGRIKGPFTPKQMPDNRRMVPRSFRINADGTILVLDILAERVLLFDAAGVFKRQLPAPQPYGSYADVVMDSAGNIYLLDSVTAIVYRAAPVATAFTALTDSMKENMNFPTSMAVDSQGRLFLVDKHGSGLAVVEADGRFAGRRLSMGWSESHLYYPMQISISDRGDLFVADKGNRRVQHFKLGE